MAKIPYNAVVLNCIVHTHQVTFTVMLPLNLKVCMLGFQYFNKDVKNKKKRNTSIYSMSHNDIFYFNFGWLVGWFYGVPTPFGSFNVELSNFEKVLNNSVLYKYSFLFTHS